MNDTQKIRVSLPPGTVLKSTEHTYTVQQIICLSDRSVTAGCADESGRTWRLKLFNGESSVTEEIQRTLLETTVKGTVLPVDMGEYAGFRFAVSPVVKARSADQFPVSMQLLRERIIPQLAYVVNQYHRRRILLRDICPEHILYRQQEQRIAYCGFQNAVLLPGKATVTKSPGFGQRPGYLAPETESYGYSVCSDYFSMGAAILTMVRGSDPSASLSRDAFLKMLSAGEVPGIDIGHLQATSYDLYSAEDRILYLVLGLMLPDPGKRWGYGEIRCWCNGQHIPLIQKGKREPYQFSEPYAVGRTRCWNERQLARTLAEQKEAWREGTAQGLLAFAKRQCPKHVQAFSEYADDPAAGPGGKVFRCIYTLYPSIDRLWWNGVSYPDMQTLVREARRSPKERETLSQLLQEQCLSFFCQVRATVSDEYRKLIPELLKMEQWEQEEPGKGVSRCMMRFSGPVQNRAFQVEGRSYQSVRGLLEHYGKDGKRLKKLSPAILMDQSFQAWLWASGCETAGRHAGQMVKTHPEQGFFLLLGLCERLAEEEESRRLTRRLFLRFGDFAPVVWLAGHIQDYQPTSVSHQMLYDLFQKADFSEQEGLEVLADRAQKLTADYQTFVSRTLDNPFALEDGGVDAAVYGYEPVYEDRYFCCTWENGLEVCPAFLKTVGERPDNGQVSGWLSKAEEREQERLSALLDQYPVEKTPDDVYRKGEYLKILVRNVLCGILAFALGVWIVGAGLWQIGLFLILAAVLCIAGTGVWYQHKREKIGVWNRRQADINEKRARIHAMMQTVNIRRGKLYQSIQSGQSVRCRVIDGK